MKNPYKIIGLLIIAAVIFYAAWPAHSVKEHNPKTGEGDPAEEQQHDHIEAPVFDDLEDGELIVPELEDTQD